MKLPDLRRMLLAKHQSGKLYQKAVDKAFRSCGFYPRLACVFEDPRYQAVMGGQSIFQRLPADILHVVRLPPRRAHFLRLIFICMMWGSPPCVHSVCLSRAGV